MSLFSGSHSHWYSIPAGRPFLTDLAQGLLAELKTGLSQAQILTPTRRGARAMAQAFSGLSGDGALLLPQIRAIGDLEEGEPPFDLEHLALDMPPAVSPMRRRFELARLIREHYRTDTPLTGRTALELADSLSAFFDSLALEDIDASTRLEQLVDEDAHGLLSGLAEHWQKSAQFLAIAVDLWPKRLADLGLMDPSRRRVALIKRLAQQWDDHPPTTPLFLAGSTGTAPAMADLMGVIARLPYGAVILPGLDLSLADDVWSQVEDSHPQGAMKALLERHHVLRSEVKIWPVSLEADRARHARRRLINEALRPAAATKDWREQIEALRAQSPDPTVDPISEGLQGLNHIQSRNDEEAASVIALVMREALETPDKTVALITPDITLSRRVSAKLSRWGLAADSSAGQTLSHSLTGRFLLDLLDLTLDPADPVRLLSLFKNPLCRFSTHSGLEAFERKGLRGARPNDLNEIIRRLETAHTRAQERERERDLKPIGDALALWADYRATLPAETSHTDLSLRLKDFTFWAESLAAEAGSALWRGADGASAAGLLADLISESDGFISEDDHIFADILRHMIRLTKVRTGGNTHPRLFILGAIEARLVTADRVILAGLEEGVWPQPAPVDPFLSRPMRKALGLPSPERRTGLSAHDFVQAATGPDVWLVTRQRREGEPQVASRWLWRLQTLTEGAGVEVPTEARWLDYARRMDAALPDAPPELRPAQRPEPKPPVSKRPRKLFVTDIELLVRDPYAIYAKRILGIRPLDRLNEPFEVSRRGTAIHAAVERFVTEGSPLGQAGETIFVDMLENTLKAANLSEAQLALQRPLFPDLAHAYVAFESERQAGKPHILTETEGTLEITTDQGLFTLKARADRIELSEDGIDVIDFKTGTPPSHKAVLSGFSPQLTLTAAIIKYGQFPGIDAHALSKGLGALYYVRLSADAVETKAIKPTRDNPQTTDEMAETALRRLKTRILQYENPAKGYISWRAPQYRYERGGNYDHLARLYEWHVLGDEADAAETEDKA
ncbi:MAG: double-strand break repair protein AddB [Asticcacaulis sp.]